MLVGIALIAATACTARACTKRLDETRWPEIWDETYGAETETYCSETRPETHQFKTETFRILPKTLVRLKTVSTETTSLLSCCLILSQTFRSFTDPEWWH